MQTLDEALARLSDATRAFTDSVTNSTANEWTSSPEDGKWSPAQVTEHLTLTLTAYAKELQDGPEVTPDTFPAARENFRDTLLPRILAGGWFPEGGKSPRMAEPVGRNSDTHAAAVGLRNALEGFATAAQSAVAEKSLRYVRHPYFGALTIIELTIVLTEHTSHHAMHLPS